MSPQKVFLEDVGSMHGTYCNGGMIIKNAPTEVKSQDVLRFGAEVTRGSGMSVPGTEQGCAEDPRPIRWLPLWSEKQIHECFSDASTLPETFLPLEIQIDYRWAKDR